MKYVMMRALVLSACAACSASEGNSALGARAEQVGALRTTHGGRDELTPGTPTDTVQIESVAYHGDGCPSGSVSTALSPDGESFTMIFSQFVASAGPTATHH